MQIHCWVGPWETPSGSQVNEIIHAFTRRSARTKTVFDWSIYSRDFIPVHLADSALLLCYDDIKYSGTPLTRTLEIKNQQGVFEALVSSG